MDMLELPVVGERSELKDHKKAQRISQYGGKLHMWTFDEFVPTAGPPLHQDALSMMEPDLPFVCHLWDALVSGVVKQIYFLHFSPGFMVVPTACLCQATQSPAQHSASMSLFWE